MSHAACQLQSAGGQIKHVVNIVFDNVHLRRDDPNVPSDLEQMPNLLNFLTNNGTISGNHHTPLISHTADDIVTGMTGVYGDRQGIPVANSYGYFKSDGSVGFSSSFLYWTALSADGEPEMIDENGKTAPAPWVPYTRAGCDVGAFSVANIEFESVPADIGTVYGTGSTQYQQAVTALALPNTPANQPARTAPSTDWLGIAIHCALGSALCSGNNGQADLLPDEPGPAYTGFNALYGNINVAPAICQGASNAACDGSGHVRDIDGNLITDAYGHPGFPNSFDPTAAQSLGYAAAMLEKGVPVVYLYIADAHDQNPLPLDPNTNRAINAHAFGPGEAGYVAQLKAYDEAFGKFFARLAADGITKDNTLFTVTPDENDHFVGSQPQPVGCNGVTTPCTYSAASEIDAFLNRLLLTQRNDATPFSVHSDDAPVMYVNGNPAPTAAVTRTMEHDLDALIATNPITGDTDKLSVFLADQAEMKLLHMITSDPARTATLTMFGNDNYFFENDSSNPSVSCTQSPACIFVPVAPASTFAWNHGDVQRQITRTWFGMVGPGVRPLGRYDAVFSDHTDIRPTVMALVGLKDDYVHDGRVLAEWLDPHALPDSIRDHQENYVELATIYKQLNAPLGSVGRNSLVYANRSITGNDANYTHYLNTIAAIISERDGLATTIKTALDNAAFANQPIDEGTEDGLGHQANTLIDRVEDLANQERDDDDHHRHFGE